MSNGVKPPCPISGKEIVIRAQVKALRNLAKDLKDGRKVTDEYLAMRLHNSASTIEDLITLIN